MLASGGIKNESVRSVGQKRVRAVLAQEGGSRNQKLGLTPHRAFIPGFAAAAVPPLSEGSIGGGYLKSFLRQYDPGFPFVCTQGGLISARSREILAG